MQNPRGDAKEEGIELNDEQLEAVSIGESNRETKYLNCGSMAKFLGYEGFHGKELIDCLKCGRYLR